MSIPTLSTTTTISLKFPTYFRKEPETNPEKIVLTGEFVSWIQKLRKRGLMGEQLEQIEDLVDQTNTRIVARRFLGSDAEREKYVKDLNVFLSEKKIPAIVVVESTHTLLNPRTSKDRLNSFFSRMFQFWNSCRPHNSRSDELKA